MRGDVERGQIGNPVIQLSDVTVMKSGRVLFNALNFSIHQGEHWLIQGPNGSGKTILLHLLAGLLHPSAGKVQHNFLIGTDWDSLYRERREKMHLVPAHSLQTFVSGFSDLFYQQRYYTVEQVDLPTVRDVLHAEAGTLDALGIADSFNIKNLLDLHLTRLSNGQIKKVIILQQLLKNVPRLLLLDYPFDGLDAESRHDFILFLDSLVERFGIQLVIAEHGERLPQAINRRLVLNAFRIERAEKFVARQTVARQAGPVSTKARNSAAPVVVEMQELTIQYGSRTIISNLNWRIHKGERWALTGRNGSGKTTLFSLIYADHPMAYSQKVFLFGKRRGTGESIWDIKKRINYFGPEQIHFLDSVRMALTGREFILSQNHREHTRLNLLIDRFSAKTWIDMKIRELSSGQLQLLLLINFFLNDRELLLLDEPFQFLDPHNHARVTEYLNQHLKPGLTMVMITHDEEDVSRWAHLRKNI